MRIRILGAVLVPLIGLGIAACEVDRTEEGALPEVDVQGGQLPEYDVETRDVNVGTDTQQVITPQLEMQRNQRDTSAPRR